MDIYNRNIFEVMEGRIEMVRRQYAGELSEVMSPMFSDKGSENSPSESISSSPGPDKQSASATSPTNEGSPVQTTRQRSLSDGMVQDEESREKARAFYQLQAQQIYLSHQKLTSSDSNIKTVKDKSKKSLSRSSLIGRKLRRLSRTDNNSVNMGSDTQQRNVLEGDTSLCDSSTANITGGSITSGSKRASTGSAPLSAGSLLRWMFSGDKNNNSSKMVVTGSSDEQKSNPNLCSSKSEDGFSGSNYSYTSNSLASSSTSLTLNDSATDILRHTDSNSQSQCAPQLSPRLRYGLDSRKYPEHATTYAGRSLPEHSAVLNEYVDWLAQCHAYGIKSKMNYVPNNSLVAGPGQPGGVPGIGLGPNSISGMDSLLEDFDGFSVFSLSVGAVVNANMVAGQQDEWISPGMAHMMMLRFPGLVVEWPKFWNNTREASGPPPGPITTLSALTVVNNPAFSLSKGNAGGVTAGVSAGAGGPFGGASLNGSHTNGPSSLKHQQQAQMHHQQQMQLWSRNAAAAANANANGSTIATTATTTTSSGNTMPSISGTPILPNFSGFTNNTSTSTESM
ncbi:hypothetical protein BX616_011102 [Lobosporangium transversale]|uniref:Uncharacterized protein n=1 Tax=Lobosporangium transversale TaxID=64571 RepID=A0A1Y2G7L1_9FUNG|nr:hypothetical protein BCR41DRAFT_390729 [Lobosporangium transversale]KAF9909664.1 hypothetical protein BX616_011102 [Lobosporangium transversale]ORY96077.1 hypothetical protein BCR41DRAFT_390729 [Lobosporangium transversale]|eukprot:XP_021875504.1 hypothetical protein BCR41DRAFT_390729 [Lobosporangium transversale]